MTQRLAAYALIVQDDRLLLCRLGDRSNDPGLWTLPGGGLEFGEHPEETAIREVREEAGLEVRLGALIEVQSETFAAASGTTQAIRFVYRAEIVGGTLADELDGTTDRVAWHTADEAALLPKVGLAARGVELAFGDEP